MKTAYDLTIRDKNAVEIEDIHLNIENKKTLILNSSELDLTQRFEI